MEQRDHENLMTLLTELISAQDSITHVNELGLERETQELIATRNGIKNKIIAFVNSLTAKEAGYDEQGKNTDIEIWRESSGDYYSPSIHVTENGDIGINVGGLVLVAPVRRWFSAGEAAFCVEEQPD